MVGAALRLLHLIGLSAGIVYLAATVGGSRSGRWWVAPSLVVLMVVLTGLSQWGILPRMEADRATAGGDVAAAVASNPARVDFDLLHRISEKVEGGVLLLGLGATVLLGLESDYRRV